MYVSLVVMDFIILAGMCAFTVLKDRFWIVYLAMLTLLLAIVNLYLHFQNVKIFVYGNLEF